MSHVTLLQPEPRSHCNCGWGRGCRTGGPEGSLHRGLQPCGQVQGLGSFSGIQAGALKWRVSTLSVFKEGYETFAPEGVLN